MTLRTFLFPALLVAAIGLPVRAEAESAEAPAATARSSLKTSPAVASAHLQAAKRLYQKFDLEAAMAELKEAESAAKLKDNEEELVLVLMYKGLIFADQGKASDMSEHFKRALAMRPWTEMPPETSPRIAKQFADARRDLWGSQLKAPPRKKVATAGPGTASPSAASPSSNVTIVTPPAPLTVPAPIADPAPEAPKVIKVPAPEAPGVEGLEPPK